MFSAVAPALLHSEQVINISGEESRKFARLVLPFTALMSRPLIVNEAAAGDLRGKGKTRTAVFAHSLQCDNVKEWLDPFIKSSPSWQDPGVDHRTSSRTIPEPPAPLLSPSRNGDCCTGSALPVLMLQAHPRECRGLSAESYLNTTAMSQTPR